MVRADRKRANHKGRAEGLEELQRALLKLRDDLSETTAWTALLCNGLCGILSDRVMDIDSATARGLRFATDWLKQKNESHGVMLQAACRKLRDIRGHQ